MSDPILAYHQRRHRGRVALLTEIVEHERDLPESRTGGGSDGTLTAAPGVPALDGLGGVGDGGHAYHEHVIVDTAPARLALLTHLALAPGGPGRPGGTV